MHRRMRICYRTFTMISLTTVAALTNPQLLASTRTLLGQSQCVEADVLVHLGEIDDRKLYRERAFSSMLAFCVGDLGLSEDAAYTRIHVARAARALPAMMEALRLGVVHLTGLRLLAPHLTPENHRDVLTRAAGKNKAAIEELVAELAPRPPVPTVFRRIPGQTDGPAAPAQDGALVSAPSDDVNVSSAGDTVAATAPSAAASAARRAGHAKRDVVAPLSVDAFRIQFTGTRGFRDKLRKAQGLLRHRFPTGDVGGTLEMALDALIERVEKDRFATGRKPRRVAPQEGSAKEGVRPSRHIPNTIRREVYVRDGGRCTFQDESGRRCAATSALE